MPTTMPVHQAIADRRSIRRFKSDTLTRDQIESILRAGQQAPSGKNRQPWHFIVIHSEAGRQKLAAAFEQGIRNFEQGVHGFAGNPGSAWHTLTCVRQAPVTVLVIADNTPHPGQQREIGKQIGDIVDLQSIGAAIENMILEAWEQGIGSLWICDTFSAYPEIVASFDLPNLLVAAVSFGYADEAPAKRPRKTLEELTTWL